jgi:ATP-dependent 26S proteasome regulatory subunit
MESVKKVKGLSDCYVGEFRSTSGLMMSRTSGNFDLKEDLLEKKCDGTRPVNAVEYIKDTVKNPERDKPVVLIFHNMEYAFKVPQFVQALKDAALHARLFGCHLILIGADLPIPASLSSSITVYDLELPNQNHFIENFTNISRHYSHLIDDNVTNEQIQEIAASAVGMTELQGENALALSIVKTRSLDARVVQYEKEQAVKRSEVLEFVSDREGIDQLGGWEDYKEWLSRVSVAFSSDARNYGLRFPKGVIVVGIQGCGKSLAAKATASFMKIPLLKFDMGKLFRSRLGQSESLTRQMAITAEAISPAVLWIDEIEKGAGGMTSSHATDGGTTARVMSTILTWMQETTKPIFFFATCNSIDLLPAEVYRRGRFTEMWGVEEPGEIERSKIWDIKLRNKRPSIMDTFDVSKLACSSADYTGAEIEVAVDEAMYSAFSDGKREFTTEDCLEALTLMIPQAVTSKTKCDAVREWMRERVRMVSTSSEVASKSTDKRYDKLRAIRADETE